MSRDGQIHAEWDPLEKVIVHKPGIEMFIGLLEPYGSLYARAFSRDGARYEHECLSRKLEKEFNIQVVHLKDAIVKKAQEEPRVKQKLIEKARETLEYDGDKKYIEGARKEFDINCQYYDVMHFFNILLTNPLIRIKKKRGTRNIELEIVQRQPLANLYFMRDQQFVTNKGVVVCRMAKPSRRRETKITKFLLEEVLGLPIFYEMKEPAMVEGGEFFPMGDFALIGVGDRTNREGIDQLLSLPLDYQEIGVVHQPANPFIPSSEPHPMANMHLDTYFNVAGKGLVIGSEALFKVAKLDVYHNEGAGVFVKDPTQLTLYDYMIKKDFHIIDISILEQLSYATNFLCVKDRKILAVEVERVVPEVLTELRYAKRRNPKKYSGLLAQVEKDYNELISSGNFFPHKKEIYQHSITSRLLTLPNLTGGFGAAHCMTCSLTRRHMD